MSNSAAAPRIAGHRLNFRNDSGETAPAFCLLRKIGAYELYGEAIYKCGKPNATFQRVYLINGPCDVPAGGFGNCYQWTPAYALFDAGTTPAAGESWGAKPGDWKLWPHRPGFLIEAAAGDCPDGRVLVQQEIVREFLGKTDGAHSVDASGTISLYMGVQGSETDSTYDITAWNKYADIGSGKWCSGSWINGKPYITAARCT
jgi:hypothetical protein